MDLGGGRGVGQERLGLSRRNSACVCVYTCACLVTDVLMYSAVYIILIVKIWHACTDTFPSSQMFTIIACTCTTDINSIVNTSEIVSKEQYVPLIW